MERKNAINRKGAEQLGWELDRLLEETLQAMKESEDKIEENIKQEI